MEREEIPDFNSIDLEDINIEGIVEEGLGRKTGIIAFIKEVKSEIGLKNIFHDKSELIFIMLILTLVLGGVSMNITTTLSENTNYIYQLKLYVFFSSPILYSIVSSFSYFNSKANGAYYIESTCKYNFYSLTAIRMLFFSVISIIFNTVIITLMYLVKRNFEYLNILTLSLSGLFIFSLLYLTILIYVKGKNKKIILLILCGLSFVLIFNNLENELIKRLLDLPIYIHIGVTAITVFLYIKNLSRLTKKKKGGV